MTYLGRYQKTMIDVIAHVFLVFGNLAFIGPLLFIGVIWSESRFFYELTCLLLFSITLNVALKGTFQIPLARELGIPGYSFPSGHMQIATIFYAWLILYGNTRLLKNDRLLLPLNIMLVLLLFGIGWSLIHCGYHTIFDVAGAAITALILTIAYRFLLDFFPKYFAWILLGLATLVTLYSCTRYPELPQHATFAYYGLLGLVVGNKIIKRHTT